MWLSSLVVGVLWLVSLTLGQIISYAPSHGTGVSYSVNIPESTALSGDGPIYIQLKGPIETEWMALGTGPTMISGNMFIVYAASSENVTLSARKGSGPVEPVYDPEIQASLLDGSGIRDGFITANIRCDNCMALRNGDSIMSSSSSFIWGMTHGGPSHGGPFISSNVSETLYKHDWHGIFSLDLTKAVGGSSPNPFLSSGYEVIDYSSMAKQQQINDTILHRKRIAHGVMTSVAFVLLFPGFALVLYLWPRRYTVLWIHAPLQIFALALALAGLGTGISVSQDLRELGGYHPVIGYVAIIGVVVLQPILGIMQHLHYRKTAEKSLYGVSHRWLGRFFSCLGMVNGGIGFYYAYGMNPDIPPASPISYGGICGGVGVVYVSVILWRRWRNNNKLKKALQEEAVKGFGKETGSLSDCSLSRPDSSGVVHDDISREKLWQA